MFLAQNFMSMVAWLKSECRTVNPPKLSRRRG